jgi:hypothetical protein
MSAVLIFSTLARPVVEAVELHAKSPSQMSFSALLSAILRTNHFTASERERWVKYNPLQRLIDLIAARMNER